MEGGPSPELHIEGRFKSFDGTELYEQAWRPKRDPKAAIVLIHGICEHSGRYTETASFLMGRGYAVETFDLRGHGRSGGIRCYVEEFDEYLEDLDVFLARVMERQPQKPIFLFGHSMGGGIALRHVIFRRPSLRGLMLSAPSVLIGESVAPLLRRISGILSRLLPKLPAAGIDTSALSRDPAVLERRDEDPHVFQGKIPARTGAELLRICGGILERMSEITLPMLLMHGNADRLADPEGSRRLYQGVGSGDKTLRLYDGLYHEILNEPEKEKVLNDLAEWVDAHIRSGDR